MTQEKQQLLIDICTRLSYGVIVNVPIIGGSENKKLVSVINEDDFPCASVYCNEARNSKGELVSYEKSTYLLCDIIPYLRPMSSMTEKEKDEYDRLVMCNASWVVDDWLNKKMFDYRGLIENGLALEASVDMYKNE